MKVTNGTARFRLTFRDAKDQLIDIYEVIGRTGKIPESTVRAIEINMRMGHRVELSFDKEHGKHGHLYRGWLTYTTRDLKWDHDRADQVWDMVVYRGERGVAVPDAAIWLFDHGIPYSE